MNQSFELRLRSMREWNGICFSLVGPIGVGKSTWLKLLQKGDALSKELRRLTGNSKLRVSFLFEDTDEWERPVEGAPNGMLQYFYEDPKTHGFTFQLYVFDSFVDTFWELVGREKPDVVVCERFMTCQKIFADLQPFDPVQRMTYEKMWRKWTALVPAPKLVFRMETSNERRLMARVRRRAREGETPIQPRKGITRSASGVFLGGHSHEPATDDSSSSSSVVIDDDFRRAMKASHAPSTSEVSIFQMDDVTEQSSSEEEPVTATEDGGGVTLEYQRKLLAGHRNAYPLGKSRPFDLPITIETVAMDADPPYHTDEKLWKKQVAWTAAHMARVMRREGYQEL